MCFVQVDGNGKTLVPTAITAVEGSVSSPGHLLTDDLRWCYLGDGFIRDGFVVNDARKLVHAVEVIFCDKNRCLRVSDPEIMSH
jgi:hypothetical protein